MATWDHCLECAALSDQGLRRSNNQDSMIHRIAATQQGFMQHGHLFMVADGMGAHAAGELASKMATDVVCQHYFKHMEVSSPEALRDSVVEANARIHKRGQDSVDFKGMGTTSTVLTLLPQGALLVHVGDSRAYRLRGWRFDQLTFDHSLVWEMEEACRHSGDPLPENIPSNIITRSLGPSPTVQVDIEGPFPLKIGDTFVLCSDGLSGPVSDKEIGTIVGLFPPEEAVEVLVDLANLRGGPDNITVLVVKITAPLVSKEDETDERRAAAAQSKNTSKTTNPVHPAIWTTLGVASFVTLGFGAIDNLFGALGGAAVAACAGLAAYLQSHLSGGKKRSIPCDPRRPLGRGPHRTFDCTPGEEMADTIHAILTQVREAVEEFDWTVDWKKVDVSLQNAESARKSANYTDDIRYTLFAIKSLMEQLRDQNKPGDSNIFH